jgi:hypothetical protein
MTSVRIMSLLLTNYGDLVVGKVGVASFTLHAASALTDAACVQSKLPANTTPTTLPLGGSVKDGVFGTSCATTNDIPTTSGGKWVNVLLGQTVTLAFNIRLDKLAHGAGGLEDLGLCDGGSIRISPQVLAALSSIGDNTQTVHNLLELANLSLAGQAPSGVKVADCQRRGDRGQRSHRRLQEAGELRRQAGHSGRWDRHATRAERDGDAARRAVGRRRDGGAAGATGAVGGDSQPVLEPDAVHDRPAEGGQRSRVRL